ncbi:hypothetical protein [Flindersiella endophytica]
MSRIRWAALCLYALAAFQVLIAVLLYLNWDETVAGFTGKAFAPTRDAAEGSAAGALGVHILLAALYVLLAVKLPAGRRWVRVVATVLLAYNVIGGIVTLAAMSEQTPLNPIGIVLAAAALLLLWLPRNDRKARKAPDRAAS